MLLTVVEVEATTMAVMEAASEEMVPKPAITAAAATEAELVPEGMSEELLAATVEEPLAATEVEAEDTEEKVEETEDTEVEVVATEVEAVDTEAETLAMKKEMEVTGPAPATRAALVTALRRPPAPAAPGAPGPPSARSPGRRPAG